MSSRSKSPTPNNGSSSGQRSKSPPPPPPAHLASSSGGIKEEKGPLTRRQVSKLTKIFGDEVASGNIAPALDQRVSADTARQASKISRYEFFLSSSSSFFVDFYCFLIWIHFFILFFYLLQNGFLLEFLDRMVQRHSSHLKLHVHRAIRTHNGVRNRSL